MLINPNQPEFQASRLGEPLEPDSMWLFDAYRPGLKAGNYRVIASQDLEVGQREKHAYLHDQSLVVSGPRFRLDRQDVHAFFPPDGGRGPYDRILPHVVFRKRALPWERSIGISTKKPTPWLAILLLSESELAQAGPSAQKSIPLHALNPARNHPASNILGPELMDEGHQPGMTLSVVDLPLALFWGLIPKIDDLSLLAHLRGVSAMEKSPLEMHADGDFSVLVANRFPSSGSHVALIVSLEGWGSILTNPNSLASHVTHLRLVNPLTWRFEHDASGLHTFSGILEGIDLNHFGLQVDAKDPQIRDRLQRGLVPVPHPTPEGDPSFAWYRGPFSPSAPTSAASGWRPIKRSEDALLWDPATGTLDISYAAAWQLGRLLALADDHFTQGLRDFLGRYHHAAEAAERLATFLERHGKHAKTPLQKAELALELLEWLAKLVLLYPVPFHYLIPNEALLPSDSLRFFHLDSQWILALAAGALSAGLQCRQDFGATNHGALLNPLSKLVFQYRLRLLGKAPAKAPNGSFLKTHTTGFLLRSRILEAWPGLEIEVTTDAPVGPGDTPLLRLDPVGDGMLLGLVRGSLKSLHLKEPREGVCFGLDHQGNLTPRDKNQPGKDMRSLRIENVKHTFGRKDYAEGVLSISALAKNLAQKLTVAEQDTGSAFLALQLMHAPEVHTIHWSGNTP